MLPNSNKILTIMKDNDKTAYIHQSTIESFMEKNPPCKECLVKVMCLKQDGDAVHNFVRLEVCDKYKEFLCKYYLENKK